MTLTCAQTVWRASLQGNWISNRCQKFWLWISWGILVNWHLLTDSIIFGDWIWNRCQNIKGNSDELISSYKFRYSLSRGDRGGDGAVEGENTTRRKVARTFSDMYTPLSFLFLFHSTNDKKGMYQRNDLNTQKFWILINNINTIASLFIMEKRKSFILFVVCSAP